MFIVLILTVIVPIYGQNKECILDTAKDGDVVKFHARLLDEMRLQPTACPQVSELSIWLTSEDFLSFWKYSLSKSVREYFRQQGDDRPFDESMMLPVKRDNVFLEFKRLISETIPDTKEVVCLNCPKYNITAEFEGKLVILPYPQGMKSGIGRFEGIGAMRFTTRYVLILTSILSIEAEEFERVNPPLEKYYEDGMKYTQSIVPTGRIIRIDSKTETEQEAIKPEDR